MSQSVALIISFLSALALGTPFSRGDVRISPANMTVYSITIPSAISVTMEDMVAGAVEHAPDSSLTTNRIAGIIAGSILALIRFGFLIWCILFCLRCIGRRPGYRAW
ncbi:hypothetical protein F4782DRAFT_530754 [Xylaria castorea]|nr:hypothetical protein F4782DRAFT_530754 [Xylaria castorea]